MSRAGSLKRIKVPTVKATVRAVAAVFAAVAVFSCSEYQKILKTGDSNIYYRRGLQYYEEGDFAKAANLLGFCVAPYAGTSRSDTVTIVYAKCLAELEDYYAAAGYFQNYVKTFPSSDSCETCQFMSGYCYYMLSPKILLDQSDSQTAIDELQTFLNLYPDSKRAPLAERMLKRMKDKLAYKDYLNAKLYFNLGNYMGNNYLSAVITAQNCLKKYPDTRHREELSFLILRAKYIQAEQSILRKQADRYRDAIDEYYAFVNEFPDSEYRRNADRIHDSSERGLAEAEKLLPPSEDELDYYKNFGVKAIERQRQAEREANQKKDDVPL